jgi:hypothetical protein
LPYADGVGDGLRDQSRVRDRGQVNPANVVRPLVSKMQGEAGLADPTGADQGNEPFRPKQFGNRGLGPWVRLAAEGVLSFLDKPARLLVPDLPRPRLARWLIG